MIYLDTKADYLRQEEPHTESTAVRALLTTVGPRIKNSTGATKLHGRQVILNVDGISIYTGTYVKTDSDKRGRIYLGQEELKVRRIGHDAMMEQNAVHLGTRQM